MHRWLYEERDMPLQSVELHEFQDKHFGTVVGCRATRDIQVDQTACEVPQDLAITSVDVGKVTAIGPLAEGRSELTGLVLWLMAERAGLSSSAGPLVAALPQRTHSPILWPPAFRDIELKGSPALQEARAREAAIRGEWAAIAVALEAAPNAAAFDPAHFCDAAFLDAFSVVLAHTVYLPSARCFALLPFVSFMGRTGNDDGCEVDYDADRESVVVRATRPFPAGHAVCLNDPRPSGERLLATGSMQLDSASDYLLFEAELVKTDRLYSAKRQVLQSLELQDKEIFPLYADRFPVQLLAFLRFSRVQDVAQLARCSFEQDVIVSQENEYEVLQLVMADLRERLQEYPDNQEEDLKQLQRRDLSHDLRLATMLRMSEKRIMLATTDAVRTRLAPIRGIPTKSGKLQDPNSDLLEIFETIESVGSAPQKLWGSFSRWARGEDDPDFKR